MTLWRAWVLRENGPLERARRATERGPFSEELGVELGVGSQILTVCELGVGSQILTVCAKCEELIKKVWEADPLLCPQCHKEMRIIALIDEVTVIERILRHLGLCEAGVRVANRLLKYPHFSLAN